MTVTSTGAAPAIARLRRRYHRHTWTPVTTGMSGASVWRLDGRLPYYVKVTSAPNLGDDPAAEAERGRWLAGCGIPVAEIVEAGADHGVTWVVTTALPGRTAAEPWPDDQRSGVVAALAEITRALHTLPITECPFDRRLAVTVPLAERAATSGRVDLDDLDPERVGYDEPRPLANLTASVPAVEEPVVCHGDLCLPNVLLDPDTLRVTGLIDLGRLGVADRYQDLALVTRSLSDESLNPQYGPDQAARFLAAYGESPADPVRIRFYRLLDEFF